MNWNLLLFVIIGAAIVFLVDWVKAGKDFKPAANIPWYVLSVFCGGVLAYFIKEPIVQKLLLIGAVVAFIHIFKGIKKISQ